MESIFSDFQLQYPAFSQARIWRARQGMDLPYSAKERKNIEKGIVLYLLRVLKTEPKALEPSFLQYGLDPAMLPYIKERIQTWCQANHRGSIKLLDHLIEHYPTCVLLAAIIERRLQVQTPAPGRHVLRQELHDNTLQAYLYQLEYIIKNYKQCPTLPAPDLPVDSDDTC